MEALFPSQPPSENHQSAALMSSPGSQPAPENAHCSSHSFAAGSKPHLLYKCLLTQLTQKLRKPAPVYQTQNEGSDHIPRFRSTVWVDGVSYTSSSTFQQRRMSEMDASKLAYIAITQKAKTEALHFIQEDKNSCKSIMAEFAAKKNIGKPVYETTRLEKLVPIFRSCLLFNGCTYPGDDAKSKKEAEQLVARSVVIKYLDSESGNDMAFIVNCKLRQYHEMNKVQEINNVQNGSNVLGAQTGVSHDFVLTKAGTNTMAKSSAAPELSLVRGTMVPATFPSSGVPQSIIPQLSAESITSVAPIVIEPPTQQVTREPVNLFVPSVTQLPTSQVSVEPIKPAVAEPQVLTPVPSAVVKNSSNISQQPKAEALPTPQISVESIKPAVAEPMVLTPVSSAVINSSSSPVISAPKIETPTPNLSSNVIQHPNPEASPAQELAQTSDKKRNRRSRKNNKKKRRTDAQIPVVPASQLLPFSSAQ